MRRKDYPSKGPIHRYQIEHMERPELEKQMVDSIGPDSATVEAARRWGISWGKNVAYFKVTKLGVSPRPRCKRCGREFGREGDVGVFCPDCQRADEIYRRERAAVRMADRRAGKR